MRKQWKHSHYGQEKGKNVQNLHHSVLEELTKAIGKEPLEM